MNIHKNARLTQRGRVELARLVVEGQSVAAVARAFAVCAKTARKWAERFRQEGAEGRADRSSRPRHLRKPTPQTVIDEITALRRKRFTGKHIAGATGVAAATVNRVLRRAGLSRMRDLEPPAKIIRYERQHPGEMIHIDIKKLGRFDRVGHRITGDRTGQSNSRGVGWEFVPVCIDDHSRVAFTQIKPDEKAVSAVDFLKAAVAYYESLGVKIARLMTDNGSCYISQPFAEACKSLSIKHILTKPYTPRTNGKAERFIQTALREWAYATAYDSSAARARELPVWMRRYNWHRPHGGKTTRPQSAASARTGTTC